MKSGRDGCGLHVAAVETIASTRAIGARRRACVRLAHHGHRSGKASAGHVRGEFSLFLAWLTIRRQNDRLALRYGSGA